MRRFPPSLPQQPTTQLIARTAAQRAEPALSSLMTPLILHFTTKRGTACLVPRVNVIASQGHSSLLQQLARYVPSANMLPSSEQQRALQAKATLITTKQDQQQSTPANSVLLSLTSLSLRQQAQTLASMFTRRCSAFHSLTIAFHSLTTVSLSTTRTRMSTSSSLKKAILINLLI